MKFYSELLDCMFDSVDELMDAEKKSTNGKAQQMHEYRLEDAFEEVKVAAKKVNDVKEQLDELTAKYIEARENLLADDCIDEFIDRFHNYMDIAESYVETYGNTDKFNWDDMSKEIKSAAEFVCCDEDDTCDCKECSCSDSCDDNGCYHAEGTSKDGTTSWCVDIRKDDKELPSFVDSFSKLLRSFFN